MSLSPHGPTPHGLSVCKRLRSRFWLVWAFWVCKGNYSRGKKKKNGTREAETCEVRMMDEGRGSEEREASLSFEEKGGLLPAEKGVKNPADTDQISCVLSDLTGPRKSSRGAKRMLQSDIEHDPSLSPHRNETAHLRRDNCLSAEEMTFLRERKRKIAQSQSLVELLVLEEGEEIDVRDVPIYQIGLGGSGGGMRANLGFLSTILAFQELDLWPLVSYTAGVSGSCWALASLYTLPIARPLTPPLNAAAVIEHFMFVSGDHPLSTKSVNRIREALGGYQSLFGPLISKSKNGQKICIIDLYSTLVSSYFWMMPRKDGKNQIDPWVPRRRLVRSREGQFTDCFESSCLIVSASMKWSRAYDNAGLAKGCEPFPIVSHANVGSHLERCSMAQEWAVLKQLTACRHERPWRSWKDPNVSPHTIDEEIAEHEKRDAWWQWFEMNPVVIGCDELQGWVPTWSFGRKFEKGSSVQNLPEHSLALLLGSATAAPAAPLSSFLEMLWTKLPRNVFGSALRHTLLSLSRRMGDSTMDKLDNINPIHASNEANPFFDAPKRPGRGNGFEHSPRLHLVDSGMSNNCPTHVFLHPARDVDLIILKAPHWHGSTNMEQQRDSNSHRGKDCPPLTPPKMDKAGKVLPLSVDEIRFKFEGRYAQILDGKALHVVEGAQSSLFRLHIAIQSLNYSLRILGREGVTYNEKHQPQAWRDVTLVYIPLLPNVCNPEYDPSTAPFSSSYNLIWTANNVLDIVKTATQNVSCTRVCHNIDTVLTRALIRQIRDGKVILTQAISEVYAKRKALRLAGESFPVERARYNIANEDEVGRVVITAKNPVELALDASEVRGKRPWMTPASSL
ncbi:BZ3500_MvSof-1268-A1-R1_Chr12-2g03866 [Microbotryum saponariae]|uniref:Lysophospholipase n=1 Tax=Microbotryum saponariae TaxID=289078 RepID=A0A2X0KQK0_9BASI|nr:BZ3500_MvSof-1268-A1-R1_Chr12-2g03866 [Microbotryum saponariae]